ncbi:MAG: hypothetical protein WCQ95_11215 [Bacteroidota bacterium]
MKKQHFLIIFIILISSFGIYSGLKSLIKSKKEKTVWTQTDRDNQIKECILTTKEMGEKYPEIVKDYCECSTDKVISSMTKEEYNKITSLPVDEQKRKITPIIKDCIDTLTKRIQKAELKNLENIINNIVKKK